MKLSSLNLGDRFYLDHNDPDLKRFGVIINKGVGSILVKWEKHKTRDVDGNIVEKRGYKQRIAHETEVSV